MTGFVLLLIRAASLFGFPLSRFWAGAIVTGLVAIGLAVYSGYLVHVGYDWTEAKCEAGKLRDENARLAAMRAEKDRQLTFMNAMAERDAKRAAEAEDQLRKTMRRSMRHRRTPRPVTPIVGAREEATAHYHNKARYVRGFSRGGRTYRNRRTKMTAAAPVPVDDFPSLIGHLYATWTFDCLIEIGYAVSVDLITRPQLYLSEDIPDTIVDLRGHEHEHDRNSDFGAALLAPEFQNSGQTA